MAQRLLRGPRRLPRRRPGRHPAGLPQAGAPAPPRRQQGLRGRGAVQGDRRGLRRAVGSRAASPLRRLRRGLPTRPSRHGSGRLAPSPDVRRRRCRGARPLVAGAGPSGGFGAGDFGDDVDIEDLLGGIFGGRGGAVGPGRLGTRPGPGLRPGGRAGGDRRGGLPRRPSAASRSAAPTARARSTSPSRRASSTVSGSGCAARAARAAVRRPAGDLYLVVRIADHPRYRVEGRDLHVDSCRSLRGRPRWAPRSPSTLPAAPPR